jgi:hypothetical protein
MVFEPSYIRNLFNERIIPNLVIDETQIIRSVIPEPEITGALERLEIHVSKTLCRGMVVRFNFPSGTADHQNHVMVISTTQWMDGQIALVRVVGYNRDGFRVAPFDENFGTRILAFSPIYCDVEFPPELNDDAQKVAPTFHHNILTAVKGKSSRCL